MDVRRTKVQFDLGQVVFPFYRCVSEYPPSLRSFCHDRALRMDSNLTNRIPGIFNVQSSILECHALGAPQSRVGVVVVDLFETKALLVESRTEKIQVSTPRGPLRQEDRGGYWAEWSNLRIESILDMGTRANSINS
ncbi:unnamed protein product [Ectocarpus sp. 12 AP-2014]